MRSTRVSSRLPPRKIWLDAQLIDRLSGYDQALFDLARGLASESASGYPNGPLFWNEIASALIDGLLARHTAGFDGRIKGTLGKDVFRRLREYILAHLDEPIEVAALASLAGRSPFHFTRVFTQSVGMSPHRYVVRLRLQRATELMRERRSGLGRNRGFHGLRRSEPPVPLGPAGSRRFPHAARRVSARKTAGIFTTGRSLLPKYRPERSAEPSRSQHSGQEKRIMTDLVQRTLHRLGERLPGRLSTPGDPGYADATAIWAKPVGRFAARRCPLPDRRRRGAGDSSRPRL